MSVRIRHAVYPRGMGPGLAVAILMGSLSCFCGACQTDRVPAGKGQSVPMAPPVVQVADDRGDHDLGLVAPGSKHTVIFEIRNPSDHPLKLLRMQGDCGCIKARGEGGEISAGGYTRVEVVFQAPHTETPYRSEVIVLTDSPERKLIHLGVRCTIRR
jgi:hypothetical protein